MRGIELTNGGVALVDDEDYEFLSSMSWNRSESRSRTYAVKCFWVRGENRRVTYRMHNFLMIGHDGIQVDHIDGNGLNNQKSNLRSGSLSQNQYNAKKRSDNTSGYRGVACVRGRFHAQIQYDKKHRYIGSYPTAELAARAYDEHAKVFHGSFAKFNFPEEC